MAQDQYLSFPAAAAGLTPITGATAWVFGSWVVATTGLGYDIDIIGFTLQVTPASPALDTTFEAVAEIGTGADGSEVTQIQIPFQLRTDTTAYGYYKQGQIPVFFPEPRTISAGTRLAVRVAHNVTAAITYNGVKILYKEGVTTVTDDRATKMVNIMDGMMMISGG